MWKRRETIDGCTLYLGDCLEVVRDLPDNSVDSVVTDPPYGLSKEPDVAEVLRHWLAGDDYKHRHNGFMGKSWDSFVPGPAIWKEALRVLKPGGHLLAFFGTRTYDLGTMAIRLAGFEIRDQVQWIYGSGFPKSLDVSKVIDKAVGAEREVIGESPFASRKPNGSAGLHSVGLSSTPGAYITAPATAAARQWQGFGTSLKPAHEPICCARKPLQGTVAENVLKWGTGAINVDGCRINNAGNELNARKQKTAINKKRDGGTWKDTGLDGTGNGWSGTHGRFPANVIHDGSPEVLAGFPETKGQQGAVTGNEPSSKTNAIYGNFNGRPATTPRGDSGSAARFFYCAKASKKDRDEGLDGFAIKNNMRVNAPRANENMKHATQYSNNHPTVKPTDLMRYLVRLVTPPNGITLDPFMGSGSTGKAARLEGFRFAGIEIDESYFEIAKRRIEHAGGKQQPAKMPAPEPSPVKPKAPAPLQLNMFDDVPMAAAE